MRLTGKVAVISGGGTGIGAATARRFAAEGARVVVTGRRLGPIEAIAAEVGGVAVAGDARDEDHARAAVAAAVEHFGGLDLVVAAAGMGEPGSAATVTDDVWARTLDVNLTGPLRLVRAALPALRAQGGGSIVLVASVSSLVSLPESVAYDTSKAGLLGLMRSIAVDHGPEGIRANAVCPGWVTTPMGDEDMDVLAARHGISRAEAYARVSTEVPLRRVATAAEVAACCCFLASEDAAYVSGVALPVDGGGLAVDLTGTAFGPTGG